MDRGEELMFTCMPKMYKKNVFEIPYDKLKKEGIKCLVFDLDNTLALIDEHKCPDKVKELVKKLKKDFYVIIITNNNKERVLPYEKALEIDSVTMAMKPSTKGLKQVLKKYNVEKKEMVMIGDQIVTDILSGNRFNIKTILVDPLGKKDLKITSINRFIENRILKKYAEKGIFKRGSYYE